MLLFSESQLFFSLNPTTFILVIIYFFDPFVFNRNGLIYWETECQPLTFNFNNESPTFHPWTKESHGQKWEISTMDFFGPRLKRSMFDTSHFLTMVFLVHVFDMDILQDYYFTSFTFLTWIFSWIITLPRSYFWLGHSHEVLLYLNHIFDIDVLNNHYFTSFLFLT